MKAALQMSEAFDKKQEAKLKFCENPQMESHQQRRKRRKLRKHTQISSKNSIPILPEELIAEILVRVPVKSLLKFKCVSKNWFDLISSPEFVKTHLSFSAKDYTRHISLLQFTDTLIEANMKYCSVSSLFHDDSVTEPLHLDCPMKNPPQSVCISGSVNGLICLSDGFHGLVIWNPSIRKFKKVSDFVPTQSACWSNCGFGYDEVHDDYKVVGIFSSMIKANFETMIYSLKTDSLKTLRGFKTGMSYYGSAKFVNGKLHWITWRRGRWGIASIDLVNEKWGKLEQPCSNKEGDLELGVLGTDLTVLYNSDERTHSDVWVMKEYGVKESWTKLYTIRYPENYKLSSPLFMYNKGEILLVFESTLAIYDPKNDSITYREVTNVDDHIEAELCIESLVCPDLQNED